MSYNPERESYFELLRSFDEKGYYTPYSKEIDWRDIERSRIELFNEAKSIMTIPEKEKLLLSFSWGFRIGDVRSSIVSELLFMDGTIGATVRRVNSLGNTIVTFYEEKYIELFDRKQKKTIYIKYAFPILISLQNFNLPALQTIAILEELFPVTSLLDCEFIWNLVVRVKHYRK